MVNHCRRAKPAGYLGVVASGTLKKNLPRRLENQPVLYFKFFLASFSITAASADKMMIKARG